MTGLGRQLAVQRLGVQDVEWPPTAVGQAAALWALARQLDHSQWMTLGDTEANSANSSSSWRRTAGEVFAFFFSGHCSRLG